MYLGRIVELTDRRELFLRPRHPYTHSLLSAIPVPEPTRRRTRIILKGDVPSPVNPPSGCHFHPRCPLRVALGDPERCEIERPLLLPSAPGRADHVVACHFQDQAAGFVATG